MIADSILWAIGLSGLALAWGFFNSGLAAWALITVSMGLFWAISNRRGWRGFASIGQWSMIIFAVFGLWQHIQSTWAIISSLGVLYAWDLSDFQERTALTPSEDRQAMALLHMQRLLVYGLLALLFISLAYLIQFHVSLEWAMALTAIVVIGIMGILSRIGQ